MHFTVKDWKYDPLKLFDILGKLKDWEYEIKKVKKDRTTQQNRYLRGGVYGTLSEYTGYTIDELHGMFGQHYLMTDTENWKYKYPRSTSTLNTQEFSEYVEKIRNMGAKMGCYIPSPEEYNLYLLNN